MALLTISRSPRDLDSFLPSGQGVGPGTYDSTRWGDEEITGLGGAVEQQKRPPLTRWHTKSITPGPDAYTIRRAASESAIEFPQKTNACGTGAVPFRLRSKRISKDDLKEPLLVPGSSGYLPSSVIDNPGPGQYNLSQTFGQPPRSATPPDHDSGQNRQLVLSVTAPSFPPLRRPEDARYTGRGEDTLSPGDYTHDSHTALRTVLGHSASATDFHTTASQRSLYPKACSIENTYGFASNPTAPGFYELGKKLTRGTSQPFSSKDPQLGTAQPFKSKSCSTALTPGPGAYPLEDGKQALDQHFHKSVGEASAGGEQQQQQQQQQQQAFPGLRSNVMREGIFRPALTQPYTDSDNILVPGPGHYPKPASAFTSAKARRARPAADVLQKKFLAVHTPQQQKQLRDTDALVLCGFSSTGSRDCLVPDKHDPVAEPGTYDRNQSMGQSILAGMREPARIAKRGVFGTTKDRDRFHGFALEGRTEGPAPGDHNPTGGVHGSWSSGVDPSGGAFRYAGPRLPPDVSLAKPLMPGPGQYFRSENGSATPNSVLSSPSSPATGTTTFRRPKTDRLSFGSCQDRFGGVKEVANTVPGPGEYDPRRAARPGKRVSGAARSTAARKTMPGSSGTGLGPGQYEIVGTMAEQSGKTFNRTAESAGAELRQAGKPPRRLESGGAPNGTGSARQGEGADSEAAAARLRLAAGGGPKAEDA